MRADGNETTATEIFGSYTGDRLVCIRDEASYYRTTRRVAAAIIASEATTSNWGYTSKGAWKRNGGRYIEQR